MSRIINIKNLGRINYLKAWELQEQYFNHLRNLKKFNSHKDYSIQIPNYILICEHEPVYTIGRGAKLKNHEINRSLFEKIKIPYYEVNRGGSVTFHGPGQLVVYFILDLEQYGSDIHYERLMAIYETARASAMAKADERQ